MHRQPISKSWTWVIRGIQVLRNSKLSVDSLVLSTGTTAKSSSSAPGSPPAPRACFILVISLNKSAESSLLTNRISVSQDSWKYLREHCPQHIHTAKEMLFFFLLFIVAAVVRVAVSLFCWSQWAFNLLGLCWRALHRCLHLFSILLLCFSLLAFFWKRFGPFRISKV